MAWLHRRIPTPGLGTSARRHAGRLAGGLTALVALLLTGLLLAGLLPATSSAATATPARLTSTQPHHRDLTVIPSSPPALAGTPTAAAPPTGQLTPQALALLSRTATQLATSPSAPARPTGWTSILLHPGDTVWALSRRYHTTIAALAGINHLANPACIHAGATLLVPTATPLDQHTLLASTPTHPTTPHTRPLDVAPAAANTTPIPADSTQSSAALRQDAAAVFGTDYDCAANIITRESGWNPHATNPGSRAYGLAQALPGSKMATVGSDWRTNPTTQLRWMHAYVDTRYGNACAAWAFWQTHHWY